MKKLILFGTSVFVLLALSACSCSFQVGDQQETVTDTSGEGTGDLGVNSTINVEGGETEIPEWRTYEDETLGFSFEYPGRWVQTFENDILYLFSETNENVNIQNLSPDIYSSLDEVMEDLKGQLLTAENSEVLNETDITINGRTGKELEVKYSLNGTDYLQQTAVVEHDNGYYMISLTTWGNYEDMKAGYAKVKETFSY